MVVSEGKIDTESPCRSQEILREQLDMLHRQMNLVLVANFGISLVMALVLWGKVPTPALLTWTCAIYVLTLIRAAVHTRYAYVRQDHNRFWMGFFVLTSLASGILWGSAGLMLFTPENPLNLAFLIIILAGMTTGAQASLSALLPVYVAFAVPTISPLAIRFLLENSPALSLLGVAGLLFLVVNLGFAHNLQTTLIKSIRLKYSNFRAPDMLPGLEGAASLTCGGVPAFRT